MALRSFRELSSRGQLDFKASAAWTETADLGLEVGHTPGPEPGSRYPSHAAVLYLIRQRGVRPRERRGGGPMSGITFEDEFFGFLDGAIHQQKRLADRAMVQFVVLRLSFVGASASLPALITIAGKEWSSGIAVLVAALTGLDTQFRWGEEWRHFPSTQLALERMKRDYDHRKA